MACRSSCSHSPPKVAAGVATADSRRARSRRPCEPPYRLIWSEWISRTSARVRNLGCTTSYSAKRLSRRPCLRLTAASVALSSGLDPSRRRDVVDRDELWKNAAFAALETVVASKGGLGVDVVALLVRTVLIMLPDIAFLRLPTLYYLEDASVKEGGARARSLHRSTFL